MLFDRETLLSEQRQVFCDRRLHLCHRPGRRQSERSGGEGSRGRFQQSFFPQRLNHFLDMDRAAGVVSLALTHFDLPVADQVHYS